MTYQIVFNALSTTGDSVGTRTFTIETHHPLDLEKDLCVERLCVEYARVTGLRCSYAFITEIRKDGSNAQTETLDIVPCIMV